MMMKHIRYPFLFLILVLSLTACGATDKPTSKFQNGASPSQQLTTHPTATPSAEPTTATSKQEKATVKIVSVTSPAARNSTATLKAKVAPGATATIVVHYKSGPSTAAGLEPKKADSDGNVSWSWRVGAIQQSELGESPFPV